MARLDVERSIEWVCAWNTYLVAPDTTPERITYAQSRLTLAVIRLKDIWMCSGHFWLTRGGAAPLNALEEAAKEMLAAMLQYRDNPGAKSILRGQQAEATLRELLYGPG